MSVPGSDISTVGSLSGGRDWPVLGGGLPAPDGPANGSGTGDGSPGSCSLRVMVYEGPPRAMTRSIGVVSNGSRRSGGWTQRSTPTCCGKLSTAFHEYGDVSEWGIRRHPGRAREPAPTWQTQRNRVCETLPSMRARHAVPLHFSIHILSCRDSFLTNRLVAEAPLAPVGLNLSGPPTTGTKGRA